MRISFLAAAAAACLLVAGTAQAATVTVRVEGANGTLLPRTQVTTPSGDVFSGCPGNTVAGALDVATHGNWDRTAFTQTILGETHDFSNNDYWAEWLNYKFGAGICSDVVHDGDEILMLVDYSPPPDFAPSVFPLRILGIPTSVPAGAPFAVQVVRYGTDGSSVPEAGVTVTGGGASATTDAAGHATLTMPTQGTFTLRATKAGDAPSAAEPITVGAPYSVPPPPRTPDRTPPVARISGIRNHQVFKHRHGPRTLHGTASDASGIKDVKLRLTRTYRRHCYVYSNHRARFARARCGINRAKFFSIGAKTSWSYLLPARLGPGRYVLDVTAIDNAANRDVARVRGRNRVVFTVR